MNTQPDKLHAIIVDDEEACRHELSELLAAYCPEIKLEGTAAGIPEALTLIDSHNVDVIFLDIQMPGGGGFKLLELLDDRNFHIVFISAYERYAIKAIRVNALDYLLKPIRVTELTHTVQRLCEYREQCMGDLSEEENHRIGLHNFLEKHNSEEDYKHLVLRNSCGFDLVKNNEILYLQGERNYTRFFLKNKKSILVSHTLKTYEELLPTGQFLRIHKTYIINLFEIRQYRFRDYGYVVMSDGVQLDVSRRRYSSLVDKVKKISSAKR